VAPTLSRVVGDLVAARLVAHAGSLERLAFLPASTIQTLGAEEALFLHLKEGKKPPKHGALFMHALVNQAPPKQRGRIARQLATKASIAARIDHFGGPDAATKAEALVASIDSQLKRIRTAPPPMRRSQPASRHRRGGR
jgi:nucleolar protein 56